MMGRAWSDRGGCLHAPVSHRLLGGVLARAHAVLMHDREAPAPASQFAGDRDRELAVERWWRASKRAQRRCNLRLPWSARALDVGWLAVLTADQLAAGAAISVIAVSSRARRARVVNTVS